jgi:hypothetical protein
VFGTRLIFTTERFYWFGYLDQAENNQYGGLISQYVIAGQVMAGADVFPMKPDVQERREELWPGEYDHDNIDLVDDEEDGRGFDQNDEDEEGFDGNDEDYQGDIVW